MRSVILFPFIFLIFIQRQSNATPVILSKHDNVAQWNSDAEFHTIRSNWSIERDLLDQYDFHTISKKITAAAENETCKWVVDFVLEWGWRISLHFLFNDDGNAGRSIVKLKATLLNDYGNEVLSKEEIRELTAGGKIQWNGFCEKKNIIGNPFISKRTFTISFDISYYYNRPSNFTDQQDIISSEPNTTKCHLSDNLGSLLMNQDFADVTLLLNSKNYSAHRAILAARSEVFAAMFKNIEQGGKKHRKIRLNISDMDEEVMDEMLRYIYTGKCQISDELAERLYEVADAYKLDELRTLVLKSLLETLSTKNAVSVLILADKHQAKDMKSRVIEFIVENSAQVLNTTEWNSMAATNVRLVREICQMFSQQLTKALPCQLFCMSALAKKSK